MTTALSYVGLGSLQSHSKGFSAPVANASAPRPTSPFGVTVAPGRQRTKPVATTRLRCRDKHYARSQTAGPRDKMQGWRPTYPRRSSDQQETDAERT